LPAITIIAVALGCGTLLVLNFVATRNTHLKIGQVLTERRPPSEDDIRQAGRLFDRLRTRERLTLALLAIQGLSIMWVSVKLACL
jgi:hypothetical protein